MRGLRCRDRMVVEFRSIY